jgi:hypothetical protein
VIWRFTERQPRGVGVLMIGRIMEREEGPALITDAAFGGIMIGRLDPEPTRSRLNPISLLSRRLLRLYAKPVLVCLEFGEETQNFSVS